MASRVDLYPLCSVRHMLYGCTKYYIMKNQSDRILVYLEVKMLPLGIHIVSDSVVL